MDELDQALWNAWARRREAKVRERLATRPRRDGQTHLLPPAGGGTVGHRSVPGLTKQLRKPLRSFCLVVRAGDLRLLPGVLPEDYAGWCRDRGVAIDHEAETGDRGPAVFDRGLRGLECMGLEAEAVRELCAPIRIGRPGVLLENAKKMFGVKHGTLYRWERRGLIDIRRKRRNDRDWPDDKTRRLGKAALVTTRGWVDPNGEVWCGPWGELRRHLVDRVPGDWMQAVWRHWSTAGRHGQWRWLCPACGESVAKLYWPMEVFTLAMLMGEAPGVAAGAERFACRRCANFMYDSEEQNPGYATRRDVTWDWFVRRLSGGTLRGEDVRVDGPWS